MKDEKINENVLSVVVPVYNMEKYLDRCIESILKQTYKNMEILLIDDGSTDNSYNICEKYKKKDNRIKVFYKKNGGLSDAKNYGILHSSGEFITFVDADDWIDETMYEVMLKEMQEKKADISICGRYIDFEDGKSRKWFYDKLLVMNKIESLLYLNSFYDFDMASWDKIYRRDLFENIKFPYGKKCEDAYTTYLLFEKADLIVYIPECFYHYFQRQGSISRSKELNMDYIYAAKEQMNFFKENYSEIYFAGVTHYVFAIKSLYQVAIERDIVLNDEMKRLVKETKKYSKKILCNKYVSIKKKIIYILFAYFNPFYKILLRIKFMKK